MGTNSNNEQQQLVLDNKELVHYILQKKLRVSSNSVDYEDMVSIGNIGLIKAAKTFDKTQNNSFATYAITCIRNEIFMHYRGAKKYAKDISFETVIGNDKEGKELALEDIIEDTKSNFVEDISNKEEFIQLVNIVLNYLEPRKKIIMLYRMGDNKTQREIEKMLNISRTYVSRLEKIAIKEIREVVKYKLHYKEVFSMEIKDDIYRITFASKDISRFNQIFATLLKNITPAEVKDMPDFKVSCNKERIIIQIPAHPDSFSFIAQIIQEIDNFSMTYVSTHTIPTNKANINKNKQESMNKRTHIPKEELNLKIDEMGQKPEEPQESEKLQKQEIEIVEKPEKSPKTEIEIVEKPETNAKGSKVKQIKDHMLTLELFTIKELRAHFPNMSTKDITNAVYLSKKEGLITSISKGKYTVNKK